MKTTSPRRIIPGNAGYSTRSWLRRAPPPEPGRIRPPVLRSARRPDGEGVWRTIATTWALGFLSRAGVDPQRLVRHYRDPRALGAR